MGWGIRLACSPATGPYHIRLPSYPAHRFWYFTFTYFTREDANMSHLKLHFWPCLLLIESIPNSNGATCSSQERTPVNRLGPEDYGYLPSLDLCPTQSLDTVGLWPWVQERNCHLLRSDLFFLAEEPGLHEQSGEQQQGQSKIRVPRSKIQVV